MSNTNVETVNRGSERLKLGLAVLVLAAGIVGYSILETQPGLVRVGVFVGALIVAALIVFFSDTGKRTIAFARDSYGEVRRVHWPSRKEATQMTGIVFLFVAVMAVLLWIIDKGLEWVIYGLLLGWK
ncbi:preprotein translocase subunit SecE [Paenalcaligenes niemegkensis]|uniref:preprotein translocase subunit SecE n=1 Tax=Paenalcaligenes niemegkensis TaxID=2895469 RepID=UPI001EE95753|nr:preprotein translocase subunit SecE [Paenalcaligenes niemegkensis]MCQ9617826.1 preprotein translocase subunit SecE [Paenalcaligenes niemegkensis]